MYRTGLILMIMLALQLSVVQAQTARGARINNLKVLSDKVEDVSTAENVLKSFVKPGMTDEQRSMALWTAAVRYRHQTAPPNEFLSDEWETHDPVKIFNVYGYCMCCCCSSIIEALNRLDGREARGRILNAHSVPEVRYNDAWHMFDCSLINVFPKLTDNAVASVDDVSSAIREWYVQNPSYHGNPSKLQELMRSDGWSGWKSKGPALLSNSPYYSAGYLPARTHGWDATMQEYDRKSEVYEYGYQLGHRALFSLRPGESFIREAGNRGLHVNMQSDPKWDGLSGKAPEADLVYLKQFFPRYNGGIAANGYHRYAPDLAHNGLAAGAEVYSNLASGPGAPALGVASTARGGEGMAIVEMKSPYVYLGGRIKVAAFRKVPTDVIAISISTSGPRAFTKIWESDKLGKSEAVIDLKDRILRRYAYWLRIEIRSKSPRQAGLDSLSIENDIQHAPRTLPWLAKGTNHITVAADSETGLAARTISCRITPDESFTKNETTGTMVVQFVNLDVKDGSCWWKGGIGTMTVPIETPGEIKSLRFGAHVRARDEKDQVRMLLSFDNGNNWTEAARIAGPTPATTRYFQFGAVPQGTRKSLLRYEISGRNTVGIFSFRVDADYKDPLGAQTFRPFAITHRWTENGRERSARTTVERLPFTYDIVTAEEPTMVSVSYEMPGSSKQATSATRTSSSR